jgi:hypothetical protein
MGFRSGAIGGHQPMIASKSNDRFAKGLQLVAALPEEECIDC